MAVFTYDIEQRDKVTVLSLAGRLTDPFTVKTIFEKLKDVTHEVKPLFLVVDLHSIEYINSSGLQLLLQLLRHSRQLDGETAVCNVPDRIHKLLVATKLEHIFMVKPSVEEAISGLLKP